MKVGLGGKNNQRIKMKVSVIKKTNFYFVFFKSTPTLSTNK